MASSFHANALALPTAVEDAIARLLPSEDVLDRPEFDAREFINRNFPDEHSLSDIGSFVRRLRVRMKELDDALSKASQDQSLAAHQALTDLQEAKSAVQQLYRKIQDIRSKAEHSEVMVQEICRDIKQLDYAKRHLQTTLTALKRLHMLVTAVDQLELVASQRNYKEAASLMEAVNQLFTHFDAYGNVSKIVQLHKTVRGLQEELGAQIFADFAAIGPLDKLQETFETESELQAVCHNLASACAVVDALGTPARDKLIRMFCDEQMANYEKVFGNAGALAGLAHVEERYPWFYQLIATNDERMTMVFPKHWQMNRRMTIAFGERTRAHFLTQVGMMEPERMDVATLLKALQRTLMFERDCVERFEGIKDGSSEIEEEFDEDGQLIDPHSAEGIKRRYRRKKREEERQALESAIQQQSGDVGSESLPTIRGLISASFNPFMSAYVHLERKNLAQMLNDVMRQEIVDRNGQLPVFASSVSMFAYVRNSVKRCLALAKGQPFFDLHLEFKRCFQTYAQRLQGKLPLPPAGSGNNSSFSSSSVGQSDNLKIKLADKQEEELCFIINTTEYCAETLPSLEEVIRAKIDPAFAEAIELSQEIDTFHDVGAAAMKCIVAGLDTMLDDPLSTIYKTNWQVCEAVGDESRYITQIGEMLQTMVPVLRQMLSGLYFTNFCDKFAAAVLPRVLQYVLKCRKVGPVATQQLLLDVYALKTLFLQLPVLESSTTSSSSTLPLVPARFAKFVTQEMTRVENALKLVGTPNDMLVESFKIMWVDGTAEDLQRILHVKGVKKSEQSAYLEQVGMARRSTGKIAEMEGKMTDMTENLKKNMHSLAKVPFAFASSGAQG